MDIALINNSTVANTGKVENVFNPSLIVGAFMLPVDFKVIMDYAHFTNEQLRNEFMAALETALINPDQKLRAYFIGPFEAMDNQSEDPTVQTLQYGKKITTNEGKPSYEFTFDDGGFQYFHAIQSFRDKHRKFKVALFDKKGNIWVTRLYDQIDGDLNGLQVLGAKGMRMSRLYIPDWGLPTPDTEAMYKVNIDLYDGAEMNQHAMIIETGMDLIAYAEQYSIRDVLLTLLSTATDGIITGSMWIGLHNTNLAEYIPSIIDINCFECISETSGNTIDILSITYDTSTGAVTWELDTSDPDYVPARVAHIKFVNVTALASVGFEYYESNKMRFKLPDVTP